MDIFEEASQSSGLSVADLKKIVNLIVSRGNFSEKRISQEIHTFCTNIGMVEYYFKTTPIESIANHIESILAAEIVAINRGGNQLDVDFVSEREDSAMYLINDLHEKAIDIERRLEDKMPTYRLQSFRTSGIQLQSHFRSYFVEKPDYIEPNPAPGEKDIYKVAAKQFLNSTTEEAKERYQRVLEESCGSDKIYIEKGFVRNEVRIMASIPSSGRHRFLSGISDIIDYYDLVSIHKYVEPFSNGRIIISIYLEAEKTQPYLDDVMTDISLIYINPENELSPLIRQKKLSLHEAFYAAGAWKFTHQFLNSFSTEYLALTSVLKDRPDLLDILTTLRTRLVKDAFTENRILQTINRHPEEIRKLYRSFEAKFDPDQSKPMDEEILKFDNLPHEIDRDILVYFQRFNDSILKTNFYMTEKESLAFRLDAGKFLDAIEYKETPFGVFMVLGKDFRGFHVRFRDIARGGIRIVKSRDPENYDQNSDFIFDENYNLANTQQKKNKDIPEGGSKGTILLNMESQEKAEIAFQQYVDGLLDLLLPNEQVKDYFGQEEILFLGPDEGTAELMRWASHHAKKRGYRFWKSFSTGKPVAEGGIPHDVYGMTTNSVHEYVLGILEKLKIDEKDITKVQTGGPDGDLGSNEIFISKDKTLCIIDGSGVLYDPQGINRDELTRLAKKRVMVEQFEKSKLSAKGFFVHVNDRDIDLPDGSHVESGIDFRNNFHLDAKFSADLFVPCGGRPKSINIQNWKKLLDENGAPRFKFIVEGANLFITQQARIALEEKGVIVIKDASANKGGVTSSSLEVLASLALNDEEYQNWMCVVDGKTPKFREDYVNDVLKKIRNNSRMEFEILWKERNISTKAAISNISDQLSNKINQVTDAIHSSELCKNEKLVKKILEHHCPSALVQMIGIDKIMERVPKNYIRAILSSWIASNFIYKYGLAADEINFYNFLEELAR
ncbi:NAD-glutamate dehydrogenase [candidate division KSB1 bacterium]|nr:NAD-glutamate dehydrogenase [candidate division KSB1 bacterium]